MARILVVDDESRILRSLQALLGQQYLVVVANSGAQALQKLQDLHYHVIISDQRMPGMDGAHLLAQARRISPATVRVVLTGFSDLNALVSSINDAGAYRYLHKPWDNDALLSVVADAAQLGLAQEARLRAGQHLRTQSPGVATVLMVEEDKTTSTSLQHAFPGGMPGMKLLPPVPDVPQALLALKMQKIDVVVLVMDAYNSSTAAFLSNLKQHWPDVRLMVMPKYPDSDQMVEFINMAQVDRVLLRPCSALQIQDNLVQMLKQ